MITNYSNKVFTLKDLAKFKRKEKKMGRITKTILDTQASKTATFNGDTWQAFSAQSGVFGPEAPLKFSAMMNVIAVSGTTPSMTVKFQDSYDGVTWTDITSGAFSAATTTGVKELNAIAKRVAADYIRYVATISGTTPSFSFDLKLLLHD